MQSSNGHLALQRTNGGIGAVFGGRKSMISRLAAAVSALFFLAYASGAQAEDVTQPSFDCTKVTSLVEKVICSDADLATMDRDMADKFRQILDASPLQSRPFIIDAQRRWLKSLAARCGGGEEPVSQCVKDEYSDWLNDWPRKLTNLGQVAGMITKFPALPTLSVSKDKDLCRRLEDAAVADFRRPNDRTNDIEYPDSIYGTLSRLNVHGAQWIDLDASLRAGGHGQALIVPGTNVAKPPYGIVFTEGFAGGISMGYQLLVVKADDLPALKEDIADGDAMDLTGTPLVDVTSVWGNPFALLRDGDNIYLAEESDWSEIKISKILPNNTLQETCLVTYEAPPSLGPVFDRWIGDIRQVQGQDVSIGSGHWLSYRIDATDTLTKLATSRPADVVLFALNGPGPLAHNVSPQLSKLGLEVWGLSGPWNHMKVKRLVDDTRPALAALSDYYVDHYGMTIADADAAAAHVTDVILENSLYFYTYRSEVERGKSTPAEIDQGIRDEADAFAKLPADRRNGGDALRLIRPAILAGASKADIEAMIDTGEDLGNLKLDSFDSFPDATEPALFFALERPEIMALLIDKGVDVNQINAFGKTALMYAAHLNLFDSLDLLLKAKAAVNAVTTDPPQEVLGTAYAISRTRRSALMYAAENASKKVIDRLIDAGADVHATDSKGNGISYYLKLNPLLTPAEKSAVEARLK